MMAEKCEELPICSEKEEEPAGEALDLTLPKKRLTVTMMPVEEKEEEPHPKASATAKDEGAAVSPKAQDGVLEGGATTTKGSPKCVPSKNDPSAKSTYLGSAGLFLQGGVTTFTGEIVSSEIPAGAPTVAPVAGNGGVPSGYPVNREKLNTEIKHQLMKEVRRYGRKYGRLFQLLEEVRGPLEVQIQFIDFTIKEAARFKRRHLIQCLEKKREELLSHSFLSNNEAPLDM